MRIEKLNKLGDYLYLPTMQSLKFFDSSGDKVAEWQLDAPHNQDLDRLWAAVGDETPPRGGNIFTEAAYQIQAYHELLKGFTLEDGVLVCRIQLASVLRL